jgi:hemolysin III
MENELPRAIHPSEIRYESGNAIEEIFNSLTHAIGAGLAIAGFVALMMLTNMDPDPWKYAAYSIYGVSQILLYLSSALVHSFAALPRIRYYLRIVDQAFVYLLIAGTYTPVTLTAMRGPWGWTVFGIVWSMALAGIILKTMVFREHHIVTDLLYLPMGWVMVIAIKPMMQMVPQGFMLWMIAGGVSYTVGVIFYVWRKLPFNHVIWHLFVLAGSISFFMGYSVHLAYPG